MRHKQPTTTLPLWTKPPKREDHCQDLLVESASTKREPQKGPRLKIVLLILEGEASMREGLNRTPTQEVTVHDRTGALELQCVPLMVMESAKENCRNAHLKPALGAGQCRCDHNKVMRSIKEWTSTGPTWTVSRNLFAQERESPSLATLVKPRKICHPRQ
jgi:hypothetical protein